MHGCALSLRQVMLLALNAQDRAKTFGSSYKNGGKFLVRAHGHTSSAGLVMHLS